MTIGERIKKVRQEKHLTQQAFAERMNLKQNTITRIETGATTPSPAISTLICREFQVNEAWLRTGEGEMFSQPSSQAEQVVAWVQNIFTNGTNGTEAEKGLITAMSTFTKEDWAMLAHLIKKIWESQQAAPAAEPAQTIDEKVAAYRAELEAEEKARERSSASPDTEEKRA